MSNERSPREVCSMTIGIVYAVGSWKLMSRSLLGPGAGAGRHLLGAADDVVDEAVVLGLFGREPAVAVGVLLDLLDRLAGVEGDALLHRALRVEHLLGLDGDVGRGATDAAGRLV